MMAVAWRSLWVVLALAPAFVMPGVDPPPLQDRHWHRNAAAVSDPITRLYWSALNRAPDDAGHAYWTRQLASGVTLQTIADAFIVSHEWQRHIGSLNDDDFVSLLYRNVLGRSPDSEGRQYWTAEAERGMDRASMLLAFSESSEFDRIVGQRQSGNNSPRTAGQPAPANPPSQPAGQPVNQPNDLPMIDDSNACRTLSDAAFNLRVNAAEPATWGPSRNQGQLVVYDRFNAGETVGNFIDDIGLPNLSFNGNNEIHGPALPNGQTWRFKGDRFNNAGPRGDDVDVLRGRYWFDPATANYRTPTQVGDAHGRVDATKSDPLFFDGNRFDVGYLEESNLVTVGPGADSFLWTTTFQVKDWMWASDPTTFAFEIHSPANVPGSAPVRGSVANGQFSVVGRYSATPVSPSSNTNPQTSGQTLATWQLPTVGSFVTMVWHGMIDPGGAGFLDVWVSVNGGLETQIVNVGNTFGFSFDPGHPQGVVSNQGFYLMSKMYDFHEWPQETQPNWDDTYGVVREGTFTGWGAAINTTTTPLRFMEHQNALLGADCSAANLRSSLTGQYPDPVTRLYWAVFNRAPDPGGFRYWTGIRHNGVSLYSVAETFLASPEAQHNIGSLSDEDYVDYLYMHLLGRPADNAGRTYWLEQASVGLDRTELLILFAQSYEFGLRIES